MQCLLICRLSYIETSFSSGSPVDLIGLCFFISHMLNDSSEPWFGIYYLSFMESIEHGMYAHGAWSLTRVPWRGSKYNAKITVIMVSFVMLRGFQMGGCPVRLQLIKSYIWNIRLCQFRASRYIGTIWSIYHLIEYNYPYIFLVLMCDNPYISSINY
jgi:hypothetical protein